MHKYTRVSDMFHHTNQEMREFCFSIGPRFGAVHDMRLFGLVLVLGFGLGFGLGLGLVLGFG